MAMVDLAKQETADHAAGLVCLAGIAGRQQLSQSYLEQLFGKLRRAALVCAARGPGGGYRLARTAIGIVISEIVASVEGSTKATRCEIGSGGWVAGSGPAAADEMCQTHDLWLELGRQITLFLRGITLADVAPGWVTGRTMGSPSLQPAEPEAAPR